MKRSLFTLYLSALFFLSGCIFIDTEVLPPQPSVKSQLAGEDCVPVVFGLGAGSNTFERAMRNGLPIDTEWEPRAPRTRINTLQSAQIEERMVLFFGGRCLRVTGAP